VAACNSRWKGIVSSTAAVAVFWVSVSKQPMAVVLAPCRTSWRSTGSFRVSFEAYEAPSFVVES